MATFAQNSEFSDYAIERELYRYYQPVEVPRDSNGRPTCPKASHDISLTAFCQLGALRLGAKRGIITLASRTAEYIVAESGRTLSLQDETRHEPEDELWHGVGDLRAAKQIFPTLLRRMTDMAPTKAGSHDLYTGIRDLLLDEDFATLSTEHGGPIRKSARSIAAFPIRTPARAIIGFYIVIDDKPRPQGLHLKEVEFLWDMSNTVMDHLESGRLKAKHARAEGMVKALGLFVEGQPSLRNWWVTQELQRRRNINTRAKLSAFSSIREQAESLFGVPDTTSSDLRSLAKSGMIDDPRGRMLSSETADESGTSSSYAPNPETEQYNAAIVMDLRTLQKPTPATLESTTMTTTESTLPPPTPDELERPQMFDRAQTGSYQTAHTTPGAIGEGATSDREDVMMNYMTHEPTASTEMGRDLQEALLSNKIKDVFARAANLTREAIQLDGTIFYDASISSFGAAAKDRGDEHAPGVFRTNTVRDTTTSGSDEEIRHEDPETGLITTIRHAIPPSESVDPPKGCNILGFSTRTHSTILGHAPDTTYESFPEEMLRALLKKYPHGKVYNFHADGAVSSSDFEGVMARHSAESNGRAQTDKQKSRTHRQRMSKEREAQIIRQALPEARSVLFYPLWDAQRERWFAGGLIWTTSPYRVLDPVEDLTYMVSFGNSIMAEIARISAMLSSQMKNDFVSSISHELRSPLHGILASVELLQDGEMTRTQEELIDTIDSCGKTLLDTINHVLDFSKVNRKLKGRHTKRSVRVLADSRPRCTQAESDAARDDESENISLLTEEVIESVSAGSSFGARLQTASRPGPTLERESQVSIIVDEDSRTNHLFEIDGGAWRRILMNLFGNAIKYTDADKPGFVKVATKVEHESPTRDGKSVQSTISLTVTDSGKGISEEFLKTHLFTPFAQEDSLSPGTGLGLSIVKHIVHDLGGTISFSSEQGCGTQARVLLPLKSRKRRAVMNSHKSSLLQEVKAKTSGSKTCFLGFDALPDLNETPTGILSAASQARLHIKSAMSSIMKHWFGMEVSSSHELNLNAADIHVIMEDSVAFTNSRFRASIEEFKHEDKTADRKVLVVLCKNHPSNPISIDEQNLRVLYLQQPHGPHKIAKALHHALFQPLTDINKLMDLAAPVTLSTEEHEQRPALVHAVPFMVDRATDSEKAAPNVTEVEQKESDVTTPMQRDFVAESPTTGLQVLLVEDNAINLKILLTFMNKLKMGHETAVNGLQALEHVTNTQSAFDIIFMDISMPVMDGLTASRKIRQFQLDNKVPPCAIIALTGAASMSARQEAFSAGIDLFLTKPVSLKKLKGIIERFQNGGREGIIEAA